MEYCKDSDFYVFHRSGQRVVRCCKHCDFVDEFNFISYQLSTMWKMLREKSCSSSRLTDKNTQSYTLSLNLRTNHVLSIAFASFSITILFPFEISILTFYLSYSELAKWFLFYFEVSIRTQTMGNKTFDWPPMLSYNIFERVFSGVPVLFYAKNLQLASLFLFIQKCGSSFGNLTWFIQLSISVLPSPFRPFSRLKGNYSYLLGHFMVAPLLVPSFSLIYFKCNFTVDNILFQI